MLCVTLRVPGGGIGRRPHGVDWVGRKSTAESLGGQVQDSLFGKPKPPILDQDDADAAHLMARLQSYRKKLARLVGDDEDDYRLLLAAGTIAMIDREGTIYVGKEFLLEYAEQLPVHVGVLAHEIGHRPQRWDAYRSEGPRTKDEMEDLCRLEETRADYFSGWALGQLGLAVDPVCAFLEAVQVHPHPEYFSAKLRGETIREGYGAGHRRSVNLKKFFPELARKLTAKDDLGSG